MIKRGMGQQVWFLFQQVLLERKASAKSDKMLQRSVKMCLSIIKQDSKRNKSTDLVEIKKSMLLTARSTLIS